jgi:hypothetical protein
MNNNAMIEPRDQVLHVSRSPKARAAFIIEEQKNVAQSCMDFRSTRSKQRGLPDPNTASADVKKRLRRLELFMSWMEINVEILSALNLEQTLRKIFDDPRFHFEEATRRRARAVHERCQVLATIEHWPPPDHPIWGTGGIMHRLLLIIDGEKKSYIVDPRYLKRIAKVYGHNGLQVGAWFALRWLALLYGAHNKAMDGIAGSGKLAPTAWSYPEESMKNLIRTMATSSSTRTIVVTKTRIPKTHSHQATRHCRSRLRSVYSSR